MGDVVSFKPVERHRSGPAICRGCKHEWTAVVTDEDGTELECPNCSTMKGTFKWVYATGEGQFAFVCACGCEDFFIMARTEHGEASVYCRNCGDEKIEWWIK